MQESGVEDVIAEIAAHRLDDVVSRPARRAAQRNDRSSIVDETEGYIRLTDRPADNESADSFNASGGFNMSPRAIERGRRLVEMVYEERYRSRIMNQAFEQESR